MAKRSRIHAPTKSLGDIDYTSECRFAIEPSLTKMIELAEAAGWQRSQVAIAVMFLCAEIARNSSVPEIVDGE